MGACIDADGHVLEGDDLFERYVPANITVRWRNVTDVSVNRINIVDRPDAQEWVMAEDDRADRYAAARAREFDNVSTLEMLDNEGFTAAALYPSKFLYLPFADGVGADVSYPLAEAYNNWLHDYCALDPQRLLHVAVLPVLDVERACREAERAATHLGARAVMVRPNPVANRLLGDRYYDPLYEVLAELDLALTVHEGMSVRVPQLGRDRFHRFFDRHMCCHPMEQMSACLSLIAHGALERHPTLRVAFLESGSGWAPYWLHRMDQHAQDVSGDVEELTLAPSDYFRRQCFISTEPGDACLPNTVSTFPNSVVFASDYPHPDADFPGVLDGLRAAAEPDDLDKDRILGTNAERLYGLGRPS
ncbi:MAG: amidohydrolase [Acidimicrobiales bacterium]|nr:amidohydrolase [Acidimicrobiales bacterium]